ncbi:MAG: hypothetical protein COA74_00710 [Gammaproteobacteria bacterium]|nr:MAG: hypothetical protein COA74_00710 [Gammaproteobacteria bacterium]
MLIHISEAKNAVNCDILVVEMILKVVEFHTMKNRTPFNIRHNREAEIILQSRLPRLMSEVCELAITDLNALFSEVIDEAAKVFLERADQAESDEDQSLYFMSMTQLNSRRSEAEVIFSEQLAKSFIILLNTGLQSPLGKSPVKLTAQEKSVLKRMIDKAKHANKSDLWQLTSRLDLLLSNVSLNSTNNPLSPPAFCNIFIEVIEKVELQTQAKLAIYSLFEQALITKLPMVYSRVNKQLIKNGVLPNLAGFNSDQQNEHQAITKETAEEVKSTSIPSSNQGDSGSDFLSALRALKIDNPALNRQYSSAAVAKFSALGVQQIIDALSKVQNRGSETTEPSGQATKNIRQIVDQALKVSNIDSSRLLDKNCDDIIAGIAMLFDFIVADINLSEKFKTLIVRLQIPILKVALIDNTFFKNTSHPARCLLNDLAAAGVGWSEGGGIGLKDKAEQLVNKIIIEFQSDITLFAQVLLEFQSFNEEHQKRAYLIERRLQEAEKGKAKAETAKLKADQAIQSIISDKQLPARIAQLLQEDWKSVMLLTYLRDGDESEAWLRNYQTAEDLITSLSADNIKSVSLKFDTLAEKIKLGLEVVNYGEYESKELFKELEQLYSRVKQGERVISEQPAVMPSIISNVIPSIESEIIDADEIINYSDLPLPVIDEVSEPEVDLTETNKPDKHKLIIDLVEGLQLGNWFELNHNNDRDKAIRCKLAAIISSINKYIFVDYTGKKIAEYSKPNLVQAFKDEKITQLEEGALFDRALKSILESARDKS